MDHAKPVRVVERLGDVAEDADHVLDRVLVAAGEPLAQGVPRDVGHRVPNKSPLLSSGEQRYDVRVLELRGDLDLATEPLVVHSRRELGGEDLHDHLPPQRHVGRDEDAAHPAAGQLTFERVRGCECGLEDLIEFRHVFV